MSGFSVAAGDEVSQGQRIGRVDDVGSPGAVHLHYEQRLNNVLQHIWFNGAQINYSFVYNGPAYRSYNSCSTGAPTPVAPSETTMDVNGDGFGDIVGVNSAAELVYYRNTLPTTGEVRFATGAKVGQGWSGFNRIVNDDFDGDGFADVVGTKTDGTLWYYPNQASKDLPAYSSGSQVGQGWSSVSKVTAGDITGDGFADILGTKSDGTLWLWRNTASDSGLAFAGGVQIGQGWGSFTTLQAGDFSGDGSADLVAVTSGGELRYYPNNSGSNPGGVPFRDGITVGGGWSAFTTIRSVDISGDRRADLLAVKPDGTLWYYGNRGGALTFAQAAQVGHGWGSTRILG